MSTIAKQEMIAMFLWKVDNFKKGNVLSLGNILEPRKSFSEYRVGDMVIAKCPRFGNFDALIARIGGASNKEKWNKELDSPQGFAKIWAELDLHCDLGNHTQVSVEIEKETDGQDQHSGDEITETRQLPDLARPKKRRQTPVSDPKKRKTSGKPGPSEKQLQCAAEDMALSELLPLASPPKNLDPCSDQLSPSRVVLDSLNLINGLSPAHLQVTPRRSPRTPQSRGASQSEAYRWQPSFNALDELRGENETLRARVASLEAQVSSLQFHQNNLWAEYERISYAVENIRKQQWTQQQQCSVYPSEKNQEMAASDETPVQHSQNSLACSGEATNTKTTYAGFTKEQLVEVATNVKTARRAASKLFRLLYSEEETQGKSLTGKAGPGKTARPALENQVKLEVIYKILKEVYTTEREMVNITLRDLLKPSRRK